MKNHLNSIFVACLSLTGLLSNSVSGADGTGGEMLALPVPEGKTVTIDGKLDDWDLSAREWFTISEVIADRFSGEVAVMYDDGALYISGEILTSGGPLMNTNKPGERPWLGHDIEFRCVIDPSLPYPLTLANSDTGNPANHPGKVKTITLWQETVSQTPNIVITDGPPYGKTLTNPEGPQVVFKEYQNPDRYIMEARIPWKTLGVLPNGKNPFKPGDAMTAHWTVIWPQGTTQRASFLETAPTGVFAWAWYHVCHWGRIIFSDKNNVAPRHGTLKDYLVETSKGKGTEFEIDLPETKKVSVSIIGKDGRIIRELIGGEKRPKGKSKVYWDGYDWYGNPMPKGQYTWKAYAHDGLSVQFAGAVGTSAKVPWETKDGNGNWGAIGIPPMDVASDASGQYFLWSGTEGGRVLIKTDKKGDILWRMTPNTPRHGTYGPFVACASNGKYVFVVAGWRNNELVRINAETGLYAPFSDKEGCLILCSDGKEIPKLSNVSPLPQTIGLAVSETEIYVPMYYDDKVIVYDVESGKMLREIKVKYPHGVCFDNNGNLLILSHKEQDRRSPVIYTLRKGKNEIDPRGINLGITDGDVWDLAVDKEGRIYVSEIRDSHRIWVYNRHGVHIGWIGKRGGRTFGGIYDPTYMRNPVGLNVDENDNLFVAQSSTPCVFQEYAIGEAQQPAGIEKPYKSTDVKFPIGENRLVKEWFGDVGYSPATWPDAKDPLLVYSAGHGLIRSKLKGDGTSGGVQAYWDFRKMGFPEEFHEFGHMYRTPSCVIGPNDVQYMYCNPMGGATAILRVDGDVMTPLGYIKPMRTPHLRTIAVAPGLEVWSDLNHNQRVEPEEITMVNTLAGESLGDKNNDRTDWYLGPVHIDGQGNLYFTDSRNKAYFVPLKSVDKQGVLSWNWDKSRIIAGEIAPFQKQQHISYSPRGGIFGIDPDAQGNIYINLTANAPYASKEWTDALKIGLGHTGGKTMVKWTKFDPQGKRLWIAGRKATGVAKPGEVYHHWGQSGLLGQGYLVGASEWNTQAVYSPDGFFVDALFSDPNKGEDPGPCSIGGGETFAGKAVWFPDLGEAYLYTGNTHGMAYKVNGFTKQGTVKGEIRFSGTMMLDEVVNPYPPGKEEAAPVTAIPPLENPFVSGKWGKPVQEFNDNNGEKLAKLYMGYDAENIYARFEIKDSSPMENHADLPAYLFKKGDAVGLYFGKKGKRAKPQLGDIRFLASMINGKPLLQAMIPVSGKHDKPFRYTSPVGDDTYAYVGPVEGSEVKIEVKPNSYIVNMKLPKSCFEDLSFEPGSELAFESEVLLSGYGQRGFQAISRNHLYTSRAATQAKMVDDIPSEARLYPDNWGSAVIK